MSRWTKIRPRTGRHVHRSNLARLEWGSAGRHRRRFRRGLIAGGVIVLLAAAAAAWFLFFRRNGGSPAPQESPQPACASARLPGHLGTIAWIAGGKLQVRNLDTCSQTTLVSASAWQSGMSSDVRLAAIFQPPDRHNPIPQNKS